MEWYLKVLKQYTDFSGRARRKEYWMFTLINVLIIFVFAILSATLLSQSVDSPIFLGVIVIYALLIFVPTLAVSVRRMHDTGKSGWWYLVNFIPYIGGIIFMVLAAMDSESGENKWGENPKGIGNNRAIDQIGLE